jgi:hypothetical protein
MIKIKPISHDIRKLFPKLREELSKERDIVFVYIFGSYGTNRVGPLSDVDIAVYLDEKDNVTGSKNYFDRKIELNLLITEVLKTDEVDLVILNETSPEFAFNVLKTGYLLFSKDERKRIAFETHTMKLYQDFKFHRDRMMEIRNE